MNNSSNLKQFVVFKLNQEEFALDINRVKTIERIMDFTRVPKAPEYIEGIINLRGDIVPVVDLRKKFSLPMGEKDENNRIIIINSQEMTLGLKVDSASEVVYLNEDSIEGSLTFSTKVEEGLIDGIGKLESRLLILLNLDKLLETLEVK
jgi:purine-binding chemotaxis protein CheW